MFDGYTMLHPANIRISGLLFANSSGSAGHVGTSHPGSGVSLRLTLAMGSWNGGMADIAAWGIKEPNSSQNQMVTWYQMVI